MSEFQFAQSDIRAAFNDYFESTDYWIYFIFF